MNEMKALFQQLVSPEQRRLSELVEEKGGVKAFRGNEWAFLDLEKVVSKGPKLSDVDPAVDNLRKDILEGPNAAVDKNWMVFIRKFEAQKNHIIDKLTLVVQRESDCVIREVQGSAHERIRDRVSFVTCPYVRHVTNCHSL